MGLKAVAVYRDGSKRTQPLSTSASDSKAAGGVPEARPVRRHLPVERHSITHKFAVAGHEGYLTIGMYEDGTPGEIFIVMAKEGSTLSGVMDSFATTCSMALQYGVPLKVLVDKFSHTRFEPSGFHVKSSGSVCEVDHGLYFPLSGIQVPSGGRSQGARRSDRATGSHAAEGPDARRLRRSHSTSPSAKRKALSSISKIVTHPSASSAAR